MRATRKSAGRKCTVNCAVRIGEGGTVSQNLACFTTTVTNAGIAAVAVVAVVAIVVVVAIH
jgi:hypothetical protein